MSTHRPPGIYPGRQFHIKINPSVGVLLIALAAVAVMDATAGKAKLFHFFIGLF